MLKTTNEDLTMDATTIISKILNVVEDKEYLHSKFNEYEEACKENREIEEKILKLEEENMQTKRKLSLKCDSEAFEKRAELECFQEKARKTLATNSSNFSFNINCAIMGYSLVHEAWSMEHQVELVRFYYNEDCYIRIAVSSAGFVDLLEIVPDHPNFLNIRKFLLSSQDVAGLLASMYKYFVIVEEKQNMKAGQTNCEK